MPRMFGAGMAALVCLSALSAQPVLAKSPEKAAVPVEKPYQMEWVYRVKYGYEFEWWDLFQKYQIPALDEEKRRGYILDYKIYRPSLHAGEESRWDFRVVINYRNYDGAQHELEVMKDLFPDVAQRHKDENRRWELTEYHWDLPMFEADPHGGLE